MNAPVTGRAPRGDKRFAQVGPQVGAPPSLEQIPVDRLQVDAAYQRATDTELKQTSPLYTAPAPRRIYAEQIVDSLFSATGKPCNVNVAPGSAAP